MKKITIFLSFGISIMLFLSSCDPAKKIAKLQKKINEKNLDEQTASDTLIVFKENYISRVKKTKLTWKPSQVDSIEFLSNNEMVVSGKIFDENLVVREGKGHVINPALEDLMKIPAFSKWRSVGSLQRDPVTHIATLKVSHTSDDQTAKYTFTFRSSSQDSPFSLTADKGILEYNGDTYDISSGSVSQLWYYMNDPKIK